MNVNAAITVSLLYYTGGIAVKSYVKVVAAKPIFQHYIIRRHSQKLPPTSTLTRGTPSQ